MCRLNFTAATKAAGGSVNDIIKLNYYIPETVDPGLIPKLREIRSGCLTSRTPPTNTLLFVKGLASSDYLIEIEACRSRQWSKVASLRVIYIPR